MTTDSYERAADLATGGTVVAAPVRFDLASLEGDWVSLTRLSSGIARVCLRQLDETLAVRIYGADPAAPADWGEVAADAIFADAPPAGAGYVFTATFDRGPVRSYLQTNTGHGVLAVHASHRFVDGSGRRDYFTREFYAAAAGPRPAGRPRRAPGAALPGDNDPRELVGAWTGLDPAAKYIAALDCAVVDGEFTVRAYGVANGGPVDWGTAPAHVYADGGHPDDPPAFLTTFDRGDRRVQLQGRFYMGVLVIGEYTEFTDGGGHANFYARECFRR
jgi:hypothetical protein